VLETIELDEVRVVRAGEADRHRRQDVPPRQEPVELGGHLAPRRAGEAAGARPRIVCSGGTAVVVARVPSGDTSAPSPMTRALRVLPKVSGSWGSGRLLRGTLFSALLTDDGRIAVGAVAPARLYSALAGR